ncbi:MAG TPA: glycoside hydrolase family 125 protein [Limnochordales bacterium]
MTEAASPGRSPVVTPAPALEEAAPVLCTGNEWVVLPAIDARDGRVRTVEVLSMQARGSLGLAAAPDPWRGSADAPALLTPFWEVDGSRLPEADEARVRWLEAWVPVLTWEREGIRRSLTLWAPPGHRGFVCRQEVHNARAGPAEVAFGLEGRWLHVVYSLFRSRPTAAALRCRSDPWTGTLAMEAVSGWPLVGWAVGWDEPPELLEGPAQDGDGAGVRWRVGRRLSLAPGAGAALVLYVTVAPEQDGARTTAVDLRRRGWSALLQQTLAWLGARRTPAVPGELAERIDRNRFFACFFAAGRTLDTEEWVALTSRSPRYYVSAAYWARDALLWALPAVLTVEPQVAREMLRFAFRRGWRHPGMHAQYLDGSVLYPGFELDQLAAYPVALERYVDATGDESLLHEPEVREALLAFPDWLRRLGGPGPLYETFLDPSDDPPPHPYLTYSNALAWRALMAAGRLAERAGDSSAARRAREAARSLREAILRACVVEGPFGPMFAWAVDGQGGHVLYDDPPGSLQLLGVLGLVAPADPWLLNTIRWVHSPHNPHFYPGEFGEAGCAHAPHPWPMAAANTLLALSSAGAADDPALQAIRRQAERLLILAPMDGGLVSETVDPAHGQARSGAAFATAAGYVAWVMARINRLAAGRGAGSGAE